jgi:hypothetical protein
VSLDEPSHPLPALITHHTVSIMSTALTLTEKHSTQIELLRRKIASASEPSAAVRRVTYLQGIAKAAETISKEGKLDLHDQTIRGWDTDVVEDMWNAVLIYIRGMEGLLSELIGIKDVVDRAIDKTSVLPTFRDS